MGIRGTGKSTKAKELLKTRKRLLIYDTLNEYTEGLIISDYAELVKVWLQLHEKESFRLVFQPVNPQEYFGAICKLVFACGNMTFLVEEIDSFLSLNPAGLDWNFLNIVQRGRHEHIELIGITQRPYTMPAILRSQCKELHTFKQFESRDIDWLRGLLGDTADEVRDLKQFEYISWENGNTYKRKTQPIK